MKLRKWRRIAVWTAAGSLAVLALAFGLLQVAPVRSRLASAIGDLASSGDTRVTIEGLDGWLPSSPRIRRVTFSDAKGPWLVVDGLSVDWSPLSLIVGNIVASNISATSVDWSRNPEPGAGQSSSGSSSFPALRIGEAHIPSITIGEPVVGVAGQLALDGHCDLLDPATRAVLVAELTQTGAGGAGVSADLAWDPDGMGLRLKLDIHDEAGGILARLAGLPANTPLSVKGESRGTLDDWRADVTATAGGALRAVANAAITREEAGHHLEMTVNADAGDIGPESLRRFIKGHSTLTLDATRNDAGAMRLNSLQLQAPALKLSATLDGTTARAPLSLIAETDALVQGKATVSLHAVPDRAWFQGGVVLALTADGEAAGAKAHVRGHLARDRFRGDVEIEVPDATSIGFDGGAASLKANADLSRGGDAVALDGKATLRAQSGAGSAFDIKVSGSVDTPAVSVKGNFAGQPLGLSAEVSRSARGLTQLNGSSLTLGSAVLKGDLSISAGIVSGRLAFDAKEMRDLSTLADLDMAGPARGALEFAGRAGRQEARVTLTSPKLRLDTTTLTGAKVDGRIDDPFGRLAFDLHIVSPQFDADGFALDHVDATGKGPLAALEVKATARHVGADIAARGRLKVDHAPTRIALAALTMARDGHQMALVAPVDLTIVHGAVLIPAARLVAGNGELRVKGTAGHEMALSLEPRALPLWVAGLVAAPLPVSGALTGKVTMHGRAHDRLADFDVKLTDIAAQAARETPRNLVVIAKGSTDRSAVTFRADLTGSRGTMLHASGRVPFDARAAMQVDTSGNADLSLANAWFGATGERATGRLALSGKVAGTPASPRVAGSGTIHDGFFRSPDAGLELRNMEARFEGSEHRIVLVQMTAKAPNGGSVTAQGDVTLDQAAGFPANLTVTARRAQLVATALTTLTTALDAKLTGALLKRPMVSGTIDISRWDIRVPERLARPLTPIAVTHRNTAPGFVAVADDEDNAPDSAFAFGLDLTVRAPREVFVRGQGIDAEFGGEASLKGTVDAPAVRGRLDLRRGSITLLSQRVTLSRGNVQFLGDLEPVLDIAGGVTKNGVTATVTVRGRTSDPQIALSSVPSLPQDEILARLLFSKQTTQLSPFEAAELAEAVGKWSGLTSGPDILERLRTALGVDALSATTDDKGATAVNAGRYVGSGVFVGVSQASGGSATVDVDLSEDIKLRGEAGAKGTKVGVAAEWEY